MFSPIKNTQGTKIYEQTKMLLDLLSVISNFVPYGNARVFCINARHNKVTYILTDN